MEKIINDVHVHAIQMAKACDRRYNKKALDYKIECSNGYDKVYGLYLEDDDECIWLDTGITTDDAAFEVETARNNFNNLQL